MPVVHRIISFFVLLLQILWHINLVELRVLWESFLTDEVDEVTEGFRYLLCSAWVRPLEDVLAPGFPLQDGHLIPALPTFFLALDDTLLKGFVVADSCVLIS